MFRFPHILLFVVAVVSLCPLLLATATSSDNESHRSYIIHVRPPPPEHEGTRRDWHESFLPDPSRLLHSYSHVLSGFSARLTPTELESIRNIDGFVHATAPTILPLHTTHTPSFLHLNNNPSGFWAKYANYGEGAIIAILDSGIDPNHPSFNGSGFPPPPSKWNGTSSFNLTTDATNKLIGGRTFKNGAELSSPPIDDNGHGTHVAGTAAGRFVPNASVLGSAMGTAAGMAPRALLAAYKVCWNWGGKYGCHISDVSTAMDKAVDDGVDVISISIGSSNDPLYKDPKAISTFAAAKNGIFVTMAAGNDGPKPATVQNIYPWVLTVGASTIDRRIRAVVKLGSGASLVGESAYQPSNLSEYLPLVLPQWNRDENSSYCTNVTTLRHVGVEDKVVVCDAGINEDVEKGKMVKEAGGAAMIICGAQAGGLDTYADAHVIPASHLNYMDCLALRKYMSSNPIAANATIEFLGTTIGGSSDPAVAAFSSRGPSIVHINMLKPDIIGPGVNILAAWPTPVGAFPVNPPFNMIYGTSMACPHLAGVAALLKSSHPDWSPAMIKSAIMTTADVTNLGGEPIHDSYDGSRASLFATGAGHVNPTRANNPGLVYDITTEDYIGYLCGLGYTVQQVHLITNNYTIECANYVEADLNYPSMMAVLSDDNSYTAQVGRTLTNVGRSNGSYTATIIRPLGFTMDVTPATLEFASAYEKQSFTVHFGMNSTESLSGTSWGKGYLIWTSSDSLTSVRSPVMLQVR